MLVGTGKDAQFGGVKGVELFFVLVELGKELAGFGAALEVVHGGEQRGLGLAVGGRTGGGGNRLAVVLDDVERHVVGFNASLQLVKGFDKLGKCRRCHDLGSLLALEMADDGIMTLAGGR